MYAFLPLWVHSWHSSPQGKRYNYHLTCNKKKKINDKLELYNIIVLDPACTQHVCIKFIDDLYPHNLASCSLSREHMGSTNRHVNKMHYL